jgi:hypothetical protein
LVWKYAIWKPCLCVCMCGNQLSRNEEKTLRKKLLQVFDLICMYICTYVLRAKTIQLARTRQLLESMKSCSWHWYSKVEIHCNFTSRYA